MSAKVKAFDPNGFGAYAWVDVVEHTGDQRSDRVRVRFEDGSEMWLTNDDLEEMPR